MSEETDTLARHSSQTALDSYNPGLLTPGLLGFLEIAPEHYQRIEGLPFVSLQPLGNLGAKKSASHIARRIEFTAQDEGYDGKISLEELVNEKSLLGKGLQVRIFPHIAPEQFNLFLQPLLKDGTYDLTKIKDHYGDEWVREYYNIPDGKNVTTHEFDVSDPLQLQFLTNMVIGTVHNTVLKEKLDMRYIIEKDPETSGPDAEETPAFNPRMTEREIEAYKAHLDKQSYFNNYWPGDSLPSGQATLSQDEEYTAKLDADFHYLNNHHINRLLERIIQSANSNSTLLEITKATLANEVISNEALSKNLGIELPEPGEDEEQAAYQQRLLGAIWTQISGNINIEPLEIDYGSAYNMYAKKIPEDGEDLHSAYWSDYKRLYIQSFLAAVYSGNVQPTPELQNLARDLRRALEINTGHIPLYTLYQSHEGIVAYLRQNTDLPGLEIEHDLGFREAYKDPAFLLGMKNALTRMQTSEDGAELAAEFEEQTGVNIGYVMILAPKLSGSPENYQNALEEASETVRDASIKNLKIWMNEQIGAKGWPVTDKIPVNTDPLETEFLVALGDITTYMQQAVNKKLEKRGMPTISENGLLGQTIFDENKQPAGIDLLLMEAISNVFPPKSQPVEFISHFDHISGQTLLEIKDKTAAIRHLGAAFVQNTDPEKLLQYTELAELKEAVAAMTGKEEIAAQDKMPDPAEEEFIAELRDIRAFFAPGEDGKLNPFVAAASLRPYEVIYALTEKNPQKNKEWKKLSYQKRREHALNAIETAEKDNKISADDAKMLRNRLTLREQLTNKPGGAIPDDLLDAIIAGLQNDRYMDAAQYEGHIPEGADAESYIAQQGRKIAGFVQILKGLGALSDEEMRQEITVAIGPAGIPEAGAPGSGEENEDGIPVAEPPPGMVTPEQKLAQGMKEPDSDRLFNRKVYIQLSSGTGAVDAHLFNRFLPPDQRFDPEDGFKFTPAEASRIAVEVFVQHARALGIEEHEISEAMIEGRLNPNVPESGYGDMRLIWEGLGANSAVRRREWNRRFGAIKDIKAANTYIHGSWEPVSGKDLALREFVRRYGAESFRERFGTEKHHSLRYEDLIEHLENTGRTQQIGEINKAIEQSDNVTCAREYFFYRSAADGFDTRSDYEALRGHYRMSQMPKIFDPDFTEDMVEHSRQALQEIGIVRESEDVAPPVQSPVDRRYPERQYTTARREEARETAQEIGRPADTMPPPGQGNTPSTQPVTTT